MTDELRDGEFCVETGDVVVNQILLSAARLVFQVIRAQFAAASATRRSEIINEPVGALTLAGIEEVPFAPVLGMLGAPAMIVLVLNLLNTRDIWDNSLPILRLLRVAAMRLREVSKLSICINKEAISGRRESTLGFVPVFGTAGADVIVVVVVFCEDCAEPLNVPFRGLVPNAPNILVPPYTCP